MCAPSGNTYYLVRTVLLVRVRVRVRELEKILLILQYTQG